MEPLYSPFPAFVCSFHAKLEDCFGAQKIVAPLVQFLFVSRIIHEAAQENTNTSRSDHLKPLRKASFDCEQVSEFS